MSVAGRPEYVAKQDGNQPAHDMGVAVAFECQYGAGRAVSAHGGIEPDLAGAALNLIGVVMRGSRQRRQFPPEFNQIAITVVPIVEDREIVGNVVDIAEASVMRSI